MQHDIPFLHLSGEDILTTLSVTSLRSWCLTNQHWNRRYSSNHCFWSTSTLSPILHLLDENKEILDRWRKAAEVCFAKRLQATPAFDVFRFINGDGIGFHDDGDLRAVRLIVRLSETVTWDQGGALSLLGESDDTTVIYPSIENSGLCFCTHPLNYHAVTIVRGSPVFLLIVQFLEDCRSI